MITGWSSDYDVGADLKSVDRRFVLNLKAIINCVLIVMIWFKNKKIYNYLCYTKSKI